MKAFLSNLGMEIPHIIKYRERNVDLVEAKVNKIRSWLTIGLFPNGVK